MKERHTFGARLSSRTLTRSKMPRRRLVWCLRNNYTFAAMDFGRRLGASDEHIPPWICEERATTPPPKRQAALRLALKLAWGFVAQSVEYRCGYTHSLAPRPRPIRAQRMYSYFGDTTLDSFVGFRSFDHQPQHLLALN